MKTSTILWAVAAIIILGGITWAGVSYPEVRSAIGAASPANSTNTDAKVATVAMAPQSRTATSTSIYNGDGTDRIVTDAFVSCTGLTSMAGSDAAGLATFNWTAATSSTAAPTASIASNALAAMQVSVATSTADGFTATSTYTNVFARRWNAGSYMVFQTNGTSSAATCTPGVHYIAS